MIRHIFLWNVTPEVSVWFGPLVKVPVTTTVCVLVISSVTALASTLMETTDGALIVTLTVAVFPPLVAVTVAVPAATAVTTPEAASTVAAPVGMAAVTANVTPEVSAAVVVSS